jgi:hypothetical protein
VEVWAPPEVIARPLVLQMTEFSATLAVLAFCRVAVSPSQTLQSFQTIDYFWTQNPAVFQQLFSNAKTQTVRIAILGDSQETSPTSHGFQYFLRLNYEMWLRYGNTPETPVEGCSNFGAGNPPADWLMRGLCSTPGPVTTRLAAYQYLTIYSGCIDWRGDCLFTIRSFYRRSDADTRSTGPQSRVGEWIHPVTRAEISDPELAYTQRDVRDTKLTPFAADIELE